MSHRDHKPVEEKVCTGRDLAEALARVDLTEEEARAWHRDMKGARTLIERESARRLASLGGTMSHLKKIPRRKV